MQENEPGVTPNQGEARGRPAQPHAPVARPSPERHTPRV